MEWIKCTDRLPPDMEPVMVTVKDKGKEKFVIPEARWNKEKGYFEVPNDYYGWSTLNYSRKREITHWRPMPSPAED